MSWFKESTVFKLFSKQTSFLKETVENADLHKAKLHKTMATTRILRIIRFRTSFKTHMFEWPYLGAERRHFKSLLIKRFPLSVVFYLKIILMYFYSLDRPVEKSK